MKYLCYLSLSTVDDCDRCDVSALCNNGKCECRAGYNGDGYQCTKGNVMYVNYTADGYQCTKGNVMYVN